MDGNSKASVPGSSGTKQDDGSGTDKQKPTSSNLSGPGQNDYQEIFQRRAGVLDETKDNPETGRNNDKRKRDDPPSEGPAKSDFGRKEKKSGHEPKVSNANDAGSQKRETNDTKLCFGHSSVAVPDQTPRSGDSSNTVEHSSETKTVTGQLQSKTISEGNKSSTYEIFGRRNK